MIVDVQMKNANSLIINRVDLSMNSDTSDLLTLAEEARQLSLSVNQNADRAIEEITGVVEEVKTLVEKTVVAAVEIEARLRQIQSDSRNSPTAGSEECLLASQSLDDGQPGSDFSNSEVLAAGIGRLNLNLSRLGTLVGSY